MNASRLTWLVLLLLAGALHGQTPAWVQETGTAQWFARQAHATLEFDNKLWVLGGSPGSNDVWNSADGVNWTQVITSGPMWSARNNFGSTVFNNRMWVLGGTAGSSEVWSSADGISWTQETGSAAWSGRSHLTSLTFDGRIWVLGGLDTSSFISLNDVWHSTDGANWTQATPGALWSGRYSLAAAVFDSRMWVFGGGNFFNDVWSSTDGATWVPEVASAPWTGRRFHSAATFNGRLWVLGGFAGGSTYLNDVWSSVDGVAWIQDAATVGWTARRHHGTAVFDNRLWVTGGYDGANRNDVWSLAVDTPPQITSVPLTTATVGILYTYDVVATGLPAPVIGASGLPAWLSLAGDTLSGTPSPGDIGLTGMISVTASNGVPPDDVQMFQIDVEGVPPQFISLPITAAAVGVQYSYTVAASGVPAPAFSAGALPAWLSFNPATGELSGTPGAVDVGLSLNIDITASNGWPPDDVQTFQIDVAGEPPQVTSTPLLTATVGQLYEYTMVATGAPQPSFDVVGNPAWLTRSGDTLSGTPGTGDVGMTGTITITAFNGWAPDDVQTFQIDVIGLAPAFTSVPVTEAVPTRLYSYTAVATGTPAPTLSVTSALPAWLTFNASTGVLSGTPSSSHAETSVDVTIAASNGVSPNDEQMFTIDVARVPGASVNNNGDGGCVARAAPPSRMAASLFVAVLLAVSIIRRTRLPLRRTRV